MKKLFFIPALLHIVHLLISQTIAPEWVRFQETNGNGNGVINLPFSLIDSSKNVLICGNTYHSGPLSGFITTKYDSNGVWQWERKYDWFTIDEIKSAVVDANGNTYIGGSTGNPANGLGGLLVIKYNLHGDSLWAFRYQETVPGTSASISNIHLLPDHNILISGSYSNNQTLEKGGMLVCLSQTGETIWETKNPEAGVLTSRLNNDEIICWGKISTSDGSAFIVWITDVTGVLLSSETTPVYTDDFQGEYHIDINGNLYIGDFAKEYKVTKFTTKGEVEWVYAKPYVPGPSPFFVTARAQGIATDSSGNVWFSGSYYIDINAGVKHFTTHLNSTGQFIWEHILEFPPAYIGSDVSNGYLSNGKYSILGGYTTNLAAGHFTYYIAQYDSSGYIGGGISAQEGVKNSPRQITGDDNYWYVTGIAIDTVFGSPKKQYLAKIKIPIHVSSAFALPETGHHMSIAPNPAKDFTQMDFEYPGKAGTGLIHLVDATGRTCYSKTTAINSGWNRVSLEGLVVFPAGLYTLKVELPSGEYYAKQLVKS